MRIKISFNNYVLRSTGFFLRNFWIIIIFAASAMACLPVAAQNLFTVAGDGNAAYSGDNGPATSASLRFPTGIVQDSVGNIYVADLFSNVVRKIDVNGIITTVAGNGYWGYSGDKGMATSARLSAPSDVALDSSDNLYISDSGNNVIRKVDASGIITTVAGNGMAGYSGDNGPAVSATLGGPNTLAFDNMGNFYFNDIYRGIIRKVDANGIITTIAGTGVIGYSGDGAPAIGAKLGTIRDIVFDSAGNLFFSDPSIGLVRKIDTSGIISTVAGKGLLTPNGLYVDNAGNLYIAEAHNGFVLRLDPSGVISTVVGIGSEGDIPVISSTLSTPVAVLIGRNGNLYIVEQGSSRVRMLAFVPQTSLLCTPSVLANSAGQVSTCTLTLSNSVPQDSSINLNLPAFSAHYTTTCVSPMTVPANTTSASCTVTAVPDTALGEGSVTALLSVAAPTEGGTYVASDSSAQVVVTDDEGAMLRPVPTLGQWAMILLSLALTGLAAAGGLRRSLVK